MDKSANEIHWFETLPEEEKRTIKRQYSREKGTLFENFHRQARVASRWIDDIANFLEMRGGRKGAYHVLRGVLFALRDRMTPEEVFQLSAQMPLVIRGLFLEGYHLSGKPDKMNREELLAMIDKELDPRTDVDAVTAFEVVLFLLYSHISEGEMDDIFVTMPADIKEMWSECVERLFG